MQRWPKLLAASAKSTRIPAHPAVVYHQAMMNAPATAAR
jgi:hypothetical protein